VSASDDNKETKITKTYRLEDGKRGCSAHLNSSGLELEDQGFILFENKKSISEAIRRFMDAITAEPKLYHSYINISAYHKHYIGDINKSISILQEAIRNCPNYALFHAELGDSLSRINKHREAINHYMLARKLGNPIGASLPYNIANSYADLEDYSAAITEYNASLNIDPNKTDALVNRGEVYMRIGKLDDAIFDFSRAIELNPSLTIAYTNRAAASMQKSRYIDAIADYNIALTQAPERAKSYERRGYAYIKIGDSDKGCKDLLTACRLERCTGYNGAKNRGYCE